MQPFENLHSESKPAPIRTRDVATGRFVAGVGDYGNGMSAEIVSVEEEEVSKADKKDTTSAATLGAGLAAGSVSVAHNRVGNTINAANKKFYNARANKVSQAFGLNDKGKAVSDPRASMPKDSAGRTKYFSPEERKKVRAQASAYVKNKHRAIHTLRTKAAKAPVSGSGRSKILLGGASAGVPLIWSGSRGLVENQQNKKVAKAFPKEGRDVDVGMLGAAAGAGGYQAAGYALKPLDRRAEAKIKADPKLQAKQKAYQKASGRPKNAKAGDPAWKNYFRNYPKDLPGGKLKRTLSRTHTGKSGVVLTTAAGLAGAGGAIQARQQWNKKKIAKALREKKDYSGNVVGAGAAATGAGLIGGGVPGARPDSGRLNQARGSKGTRTEKTRHLVSATRGGVFGYRQDAHQRFLNDQNSRLKNWKPHSRENAFERGRESGKTIPEMKIIRHMKNARTASNVLAVGGAGAVGAGLIARQRNKSKVAKAKDDYKFRSDAMMTAGGTTAVGSAIGAQALNAQGRKWAKDSAENLDAAQKKNPAAGGYTVKKPKRGGVPDVKPTRTSNDIMYSGSKETFAGKPRREAHRLGAMRGKAAQGRYFAKVYGNSAKALNRYGIGGGLALVGAGVHHKKYKTTRRDVEKALFNKPTLHRLEPSKAKRPPSIKPPKPKNNVPTIKPPTVQRTKRPMSPKPAVKQTGIGQNVNKSMPDQADVHVMGNLKAAKKKERKKFPPATRVQKSSTKKGSSWSTKDSSRKHNIASGALLGAAGAYSGAITGRNIEGTFKGRPQGSVLRPKGKGAVIGASVGGPAMLGFMHLQGKQERKRIANKPISKSWIPGKGWVPAAQAGKSALKTAQWSGAHSSMRRVSDADKVKADRMRTASDQIKQIQREGKDLGVTRNKHGAPVQRTELSERQMRDTVGPGVEAFATNTGGRRGAKQIFTKPNAEKKYVEHELAHTAPKRSSSRLHDIIQSGSRLAREEARADMAGGMRYRSHAGRGAPKEPTSNYSVTAGNREERSHARRMGAVLRGPDSAQSNMYSGKNMRGYRKVQDNIARGQGEKVPPYMRMRTTRTLKDNSATLGVGAATTAGGAAVGANLPHRDERKGRKRA